MSEMIEFPQSKFCERCPEVNLCKSPIADIVVAPDDPEAVMPSQGLVSRLAGRVASLATSRLPLPAQNIRRTLFPIDESGRIGPAFGADVVNDTDARYELEELRSDLRQCAGPEENICPVMDGRVVEEVPAGVELRAKWHARMLLGRTATSE
ncbi:MAG: hypothetical protein QG629_423 [Patescibacteria group bacterium]|nr:hypothetical protein [Candidatus Saccharibacteria bacterium]MDQ5963341.1 hypothetical protein [Patescibacteria group bacterium]